jgi:uncharacterized protein YfaS (alpha-2-macroglobulin family)
MKLSQIKHRGDGITVRCITRDKNGELVDPDSQTVKVYDSRGALKSILSTTKEETGKHTATYVIPDDAEFGDWFFEWKVTLGTYPETSYFYFTVQKKPHE